MYFHRECKEPLKSAVRRAVQEAYDLWCMVTLYVDPDDPPKEKQQRSRELQRKSVSPVWLKRRQRRLAGPRQGRQRIKALRSVSSYKTLSDEEEALIPIPPISKPEVDGNIDPTVQRILQRIRRKALKKKL